MLPVYEIIDYTGNRYLLSKAVMKRGRQINFVGDDELEGYDGKIVSLAMGQILKKDINYYLREEEKKKEQ
ncbi:MAG: DNA-directed RNA polymerase subunit omega [Spirochaetes bacterium]|nr:DNA-directed RNA polymerase subunit omega [Spirochaetota bacterium]